VPNLTSRKVTQDFSLTAIQNTFQSVWVDFENMSDGNICPRADSRRWLCGSFHDVSQGFGKIPCRLLASVA